MANEKDAKTQKLKNNKKEEIKTMDETDIKIFKRFGMSQYNEKLSKIIKENKKLVEGIKTITGIKKSDTGLALPSQWNLKQDQMILSKQALHVAVCSKIMEPTSDNPKYLINLKHIAKFVVGLGNKIAPSDVEEGMRVGVARNKYTIEIPLPAKIDSSVTTMTVEEKPDVTYNDIGGCKEQIQKLREVLELPLLAPDKFVNLGIDPPKGVLLFGPPGTGKTLVARAIANRTDDTFIR